MSPSCRSGCMESVRAGRLQRPDLGRDDDAFPRWPATTTTELVLWMIFTYNFVLFATIAFSGGIARCRCICGVIYDIDWWLCRMFGHVHGALVLICGFHCGVRFDMLFICAIIIWLFQAAVEDRRLDRFFFHFIAHGLMVAFVYHVFGRHDCLLDSSLFMNTIGFLIGLNLPVHLWARNTGFEC